MQKGLLLVVGIMSVVLSLLGCSEEDGMPLQPQTLPLSAPSKVDYSIDWAFADQDGRNEAILIEAEKDKGRYYCLGYPCVGYEGQCKWWVQQIVLRATAHIKNPISLPLNYQERDDPYMARYYLAQWERSSDVRIVWQQTIDGKIPGDLNGDGWVELTDFSLVSRYWQITTADPWFNPRWDLNEDGVIDIYELSVVSMYWGKTAYSLDKGFPVGIIKPGMIVQFRYQAVKSRLFPDGVGFHTAIIESINPASMQLIDCNFCDDYYVCSHPYTLERWRGKVLAWTVYEVVGDSSG